MLFKNTGKEFTFRFNGEEYKIPEGEFEITNESIARHVESSVMNWDDIKGKDGTRTLEVAGESRQPAPRGVIEKREEPVKPVESEVKKSVGRPRKDDLEIKNETASSTETSK